jgi:hypothetical protein
MLLLAGPKLNRVGAGLSYFVNGEISCLPSIQRKPGAVEELVDLGKSDTISVASGRNPRSKIENPKLSEAYRGQFDSKNEALTPEDTLPWERITEVAAT